MPFWTFFELVFTTNAFFEPFKEIIKSSESVLIVHYRIEVLDTNLQVVTENV